MTAHESRHLASKRWHKNNREAIRQYSLEYYEQNKDKLGQQSAIYRANERLANPRGIMLRTSKHRAKKLGIDFNLTTDDICIPMCCPVLGIPLTKSDKAGGSPDSPSIDRIDNTRGYVKGNVRVISNRANKLKSNATVRELELVLRDLKHYENQNRPGDDEG